MKLLILTQAVDTENRALGFFTQWIAAIAERAEHIDVICLEEGSHALPPNVRVHSLGKEEGVGKLTYIYRFFACVISLRHRYDTVFVHMNEEYILMGGLLWKLLGKRVFMWRNHYAGSWKTTLAAALCTKVFCTSKYSYTARYKKTSLMPVGVDLERFLTDTPALRAPRSILFLSRIAPSKRPEMLIDALGDILARGISFTASIVGSPKEEDIPYYESLKARAEMLGLHDRVRFLPGVANDDAAALYRAHDIFVNCSPSGMFDKTLFEAAASGCRVLASSGDFKDAAGDHSYFTDSDSLADRLIETLSEDEDAIERRRVLLLSLARQESLSTLADQLVMKMQ